MDFFSPDSSYLPRSLKWIFFFFSDVKKMFPTSVPLCFSILYFVWVLLKQGLKSGKRGYRAQHMGQLSCLNDISNQLNLLFGILNHFLKLRAFQR